MAVNRSGAGVHPKTRRAGQTSHGLTEQTGGMNSGVLDRTAVGRRVAAIHAATGEIDKDVRALQMRGPITQACAVPAHDLPGRESNAACNHHNMLTLTMEMAGKQVSHLAAAAGKNDSKRVIHGAASTNFSSP